MDLHQEINNVDVSFLSNADQADDTVVIPIELTNTTGTCLEELNADCLREIFSNKSLTLMDLCSLAETCTRFKQITENIFPKDFSVAGTYCTSNEYKFKSKNYGKFYGSVQDVQRILKNFGPCVSTVFLRWDDRLVKPVAKYCDSLERLKIKRLDGSKGLTMKLKTVFQRLQALSFYGCDLMTVITCPYINCDSLIELKITYSSGCVAILKNTFPNLERFTFHGNCIFSEYYDNFSEILPNFLGRHKRLRTLELSSRSVHCSSQLIQIIDKNCMELTNLALHWWYSPRTSFNFSNLNNLAKLSMLDVRLDYIDHRQLVALLEVFKSLRTLKLSYFDDLPIQILIVLSQLQNLRKLHLECGDFDRIPWSMLPQLKALYLRESLDEFAASVLLNIVSELTNLEELEYIDDEDEDDMFKLGSEDFSEIVKIVKRRPHKLTLKCKLSENVLKNCDKNQNVNLIEYTDYDYN